MKYEFSQELQELAEDISRRIFPHVKISRMKCFVSYGTSTKHTIARCHALGKLMQKAMGVGAFYAIEFLHENFNKLPEEEKVKVVIHELMHIPESFGGGFKQHDVVCDANVDEFYKLYLYCKKKGTSINAFNYLRLKR